MFENKRELVNELCNIIVTTLLAIQFCYIKIKQLVHSIVHKAK